MRKSQKASSNRQAHLLLLLLPSLYPTATMADEDPRHEQLSDAIWDEDDATALSIVRGGVDVNGVSPEGTHLCFASFCNCVAVVSCLLELGADADMTMPGNGTPLIPAAGNGQRRG